MKLATKLFFLSSLCLAVSTNAQNECRTNSQGDVGVCEAPLASSCQGGSLHPSVSCSGGQLCCIPKSLPTQEVCTNLNGERGVCLDRDLITCDGGVFERGFCPGPANIQCCIKRVQTPPPVPLPPTPPPSLRPSPPASTPATSIIRKESSALTPTERRDLVNAINKLHEEGTWGEFAALHAQFFSRGIHNGPQFWPWHRVFLAALEEELSRVAGKEIRYPYWDWTKTSRQPQTSAVFEEDFFGGFAPNADFSGCVETGPFATWEPCLRRNKNYRGTSWDVVDVQNAFQVNREIGTTNAYTSVVSNVERLHNSIHNNIGGDMRTINSPIDPVFWAHHAYIDKIWSDWQSLSPENERAYAEGLSNDQIIHYEKYTVQDTFNMRPYEGVENRRRLVQTVHRHLKNGALSKDRVLYEESPDTTFSFSALHTLSAQQLASVPRTCPAPEANSEVVTFWSDDMLPLFQSSAARVKSTVGGTPDCVDNAALSLLLGEVDVNNKSSFNSYSPATIVAIGGGVVAFAVIATFAVMIQRRKKMQNMQAAAQTQHQYQYPVANHRLPDL